MMGKKVAIIMPAYNSENYIFDAINAIKKQDHNNWELFIVDDCSTNEFPLFRGNSKTPTDEYGYPYPETIHVITNETNRGPANSRNVALEAIIKDGTFDYVAYCDSDDFWSPNHLSWALKTLEETGAKMYYGDVSFQNSKKEMINVYGIPHFADFKRENLLKQNFIFISTVVHSVECIQPFDHFCVPKEDWDMWLRISDKFNVVHSVNMAARYTWKNEGSYYGEKESSFATHKVEAKHRIIKDDLNDLKIKLEIVEEFKRDLMKVHDYENASRYRDYEKKILERIHIIEKDPQSIPGWLSREEGEALALYAKDRKCIEIGSYKGRSTNYIVRTAKHVHCVDTFKADGGGQHQHNDFQTLQDFFNNTHHVKHKITPVIGNSVDYASEFSDDEYEMLFIDGMHDYESCKNDLLAYWPKLKIGATICFHDYQKDWPGVIKVVDEYFGGPEKLHDTIAAVTKRSESLVPMFIRQGIIPPPEAVPIDAGTEFSPRKSMVERYGRITKDKIVIQPFSSKIPNSNKQNPKNYPHWHKVVELLKSKGYYIVQIGSPGEPFIGADEAVLNASFDKLKKILDESLTFICVDSFFQHFAHYYNRNGMVIFSQSDPEIFGYPENVNILKDIKYLRKNQFSTWAEAEYNEEAFESPENVVDKFSTMLLVKHIAANN